MTLLRFDNPALADVFGRAGRETDDGAPSTSAVTAARGCTMTVRGTVQKSGVLLGLLVASARVAWRICEVLPAAGWPLAGAGAIAAVVVAVLTGTKPERARVTAPVYAGLEGLSLGALSFAAELEVPGVVVQATVATFAVLGAMLLAYAVGLVRVTAGFTRVVTTATAAIALTYVLDLGLAAVGMDVPLLHSGGGVGALVSLAVIAVVAFNLVLDFAFVEQAVEDGADPELEWFGAFGMVVSLVWLYIEILFFILEHMGDD